VRVINPEDLERANALLADENPEALWPDWFEAAYIGPARRCGQPTLAAFSVSKCIQILMERDGMEYDEAMEFFDFNVAGAWCGPGTPIWIDDVDQSFLGPEDLPSGLEDPWPAPVTTTPTDTTGETPPGTADSTPVSTAPGADTSSASDDSMRSRH
jgi:hypothetical protein